MRNRARNVVMGMALAPLALFGLVAVYAHGTAQIVWASLAVGLFGLAVVIIYMLERPSPRRTRHAPDAHANDGADGAIDLDLGVRWNRDRPDAWFVQRDGGALLILKPEVHDRDRRLVVLVWTPCRAARVGPPAPTGADHWVTEVKPSGWIADLGDESPASDLRHYVVATNAETIEVVAPGVVVHRVERIRLAADSGSDESRS